MVRAPIVHYEDLIWNMFNKKHVSYLPHTILNIVLFVVAWNYN